LPNRAYQRGANFEREVIELLTQQGWRCQRSAGSHGPADLWAARQIIHWDGTVWTRVLHVQCKAGNATVTPDDLRALRDLQAFTGGHIAVATKKNGYIIIKEV
jgi:Holliday junction resolvase